MANGTKQGLAVGLDYIRQNLREDRQLEQQYAEKERDKSLKAIEMGIQRGLINTPEQIRIIAGGNDYLTDRDVQPYMVMVQTQQTKYDPWADITKIIENNNLSPEQKKQLSANIAVKNQVPLLELTRFQDQYGLNKKENGLNIQSNLDDVNNLYNKLSDKEKTRFKQNFPNIANLLFEYKPRESTTGLTPADRQRQEQLDIINKQIQTLVQQLGGTDSISAYSMGGEDLLPEEVKPLFNLYKELQGVTTELDKKPLAPKAWNELRTKIKNTLNPQAPKQEVRPRATNPQTGEVVEWDGKKWVKVNGK